MISLTVRVALTPSYCQTDRKIGVFLTPSLSKSVDHHLQHLQEAIASQVEVETGALWESSNNDDVHA